MKLLWEVLGWGTVVVLVLLGLYALAVIVGAWLKVKGAPREEMFWCSKHGEIRKKYCIDFAGMPYCSLCFHERMKGIDGFGRKNV